ncbi:MAG: helix-turn-helix domain-containing protein [Actinomycetota bacterium]|nr:helix-turn-helix domain-containing protein [Actinomycetota bacterium]
MILKELFNTLVERFGGQHLASGDPGCPIKGLALDEEVEGWLGPGEVVVTARTEIKAKFLAAISEGGAPAVVWRTEDEPSPESVRLAEGSGLGLLAISPDVPLRELLALFTRDEEREGLLRYSHGVARALLEDASGEPSISKLVTQLADLLDRSVVVEDPVGRLIAGGDPAKAGDGGGSKALTSILDAHELRASRGSSIEETRRDRRDRYARLPDGFLSVPVERWRVAETELFWTPIGSPVSAGYLWIDLADSTLRPKDVVVLYWAARTLEAELGKERVRLETQLGVRGDFIDDVVSRHHGSVELLLQRAQYLGADLTAGALVVVVDIDDFAGYLSRRKLKESAIQELKRRLADAVRLQTRQLFSNFLLGPRSDNVILLLGASPDTSPEELSEEAISLASRIQRYIKGLLPDLTVSVGIGRFKEDPARLAEAYSEAEVALEIGHRIEGPSSVSTFERTGTYKLLFRVLQEEPEELESFYTETLAPVVAYDSRYGTELIATLMTYLGNDASTAKTASDLFAHRHTIRYRLDRVKELTRLDVDKSEDRERLTLGIKAMQLLGRAPEKPSSFADR